MKTTKGRINRELQGKPEIGMVTEAKGVKSFKNVGDHQCLRWKLSRLIGLDIWEITGSLENSGVLMPAPRLQ